MGDNAKYTSDRFMQELVHALGDVVRETRY